MSHENRILLLTLASGAVGVVLALVLLWTGDHEFSTRWSLTFLVVMIWLGFAFALRSAVIRPLQTLSNMQSALREGDFSFRVRGAKMGDALGELMIEVNTLSEMLREQRLGAMEASALLTTVMTEIDVAVFAFDGDRRLRLVNRAGERVMAQNAERLLGKSAEDLGLSECLEGESARTLEKNFPGQSGRWGVRRSVFRQGGKPHYLVVIADLSRALREEERQAWQRLVRVLGHELNNSLAPICSIAGSLEDIMKREVRAADWEDDLRRGLRVIVDRSDALSRFMRDYSRLTRLPKPQLRPTEVNALVSVAAGLERRIAVTIEPGPEVTLDADPDQLQQLLINLIRNAVDASLENGGKGQSRLVAEWKLAPSVCAGRRPRNRQSIEFICALLHHQTRWVRHRLSLEPANRRGSRGKRFSAQSHRRQWLRSGCPVAARKLSEYQNPSPGEVQCVSSKSRHIRGWAGGSENNLR